MTGALAGVRVLDLGRLLAAPWAAQILGDLGADVIKVERPGGGDLARAVGPGFLGNGSGEGAGESSLYLSGNRNKRSITVDMRHPAGQKIIRDLAACSDVLVENFVPGTLARYRLDYPSLREVNPQLIYCSVTGYGQDGPSAARPGYDGILQANSGLMSATGLPDGEPGGGPMRIGPSTIDVATGANAVIGILAALWYRERVSHEGQYLDMSLLNTAIAAQSHMMTDYLMTGRLPRRTGNGGGPTSRVFLCQDGAVLISVRADDEFGRLCEILGAPELAGESRFATQAERVKCGAELISLLEPLFVVRKKAEIVNEMQQARIAGAVVHDYAEVFADPQVQYQGTKVEMDHPLSATGSVPGVASPIRLSETPVAYARRPPMLGEHTDEVLRELLHYDDVTIERLRREGCT
jgi:crotonobetainyl-CoA:carnitine CoA-transferase CaiB-like acyl-CoA transferase